MKAKINLTQEQFDAWIAALESGKYKQTTGRLRSGNAFCCLGVLVDVLGCEWRVNGDAVIQGHQLDGSLGQFGYELGLNCTGKFDSGNFSESTLKKIDAELLPLGVSRGSLEALTELNDSEVSFKTITCVIRDCFEPMGND